MLRSQGWKRPVLFGGPDCRIGVGVGGDGRGRGRGRGVRARCGLDE